MIKEPSPKTARHAGSTTEKLIALAFTRGGKLLATTAVENDQVKFDLDPEQLHYARVFVLPEPPGGTKGLTLERVERMRAYEPVIRLNQHHAIDVSLIPDELRLIWPWVKCCTQGRVTKQFSILGFTFDTPVCNAIVHICEVDPIRLVLPRIPDHIIDRLRDVFLERIPIPIPRPLPDPPPFRHGMSHSLPRPIASRVMHHQPSVSRSLAAEVAAAPRINLPDELKFELSYADTAMTRSLLQEHLTLFRPYLCGWPFIWPYLYRCDEITTVRTDHNGRFAACFYRQLFEEQADLYFWVEYEINGVPTTVYHPPIACNTYWDYDCTEDIHIRISDPRVPFGCFEPLPGEVVWVKTIGSNCHVSTIEQQGGASIVQQGQNFQTVGLTNFATAGLGFGLDNQHVRPFAGDLPFVVQFGSAFPGANVTHYRWSYRKTHTDKLLPASASDQEWTPLDSRLMSKPYTVEEIDGLSTIIKTKHYPLGPVTIGSIEAYRIPPTEPLAAGIVDPTAQWDQNTVTMIADAHGLKGDGLYEFKLEFFNGSGVRQNVLDAVNQVSDPSDVTQSMPATADFLTPAADDSFKPFRMKVRIDTQAATAEIYDATVDGSTTTTDCGFAEYTDKATSTATLAFRAEHPNHFAVFSFDVHKGNVPGAFTPADTAGMVIGSTAEYTLGGDDIYRKTIPVATLLGSCDQAAFAENLYVDCLHTNGSSVLNDFDAPDLAAFAIEPAEA